MYATGARPGEIIALQWDDIDFERKIIKIYKTRMRDKEGDTKTLASTREVDLLPQAEEALMDQKLITGEEGYIFVNSSKKAFYSHDIIGVNFQKLLAKCGVQARVLYNLRHTFASQLISKGADIVWVSKMLGHKDVSITLKVYTKFIEEDDEKRF
jgi:integrase